jgi:cation transport ATPase
VLKKLKPKARTKENEQKKTSRTKEASESDAERRKKKMSREQQSVNSVPVPTEKTGKTEAEEQSKQNNTETRRLAKDIQVALWLALQYTAVLVVLVQRSEISALLSRNYSFPARFSPLLLLVFLAGGLTTISAALQLLWAGLAFASILTILVLVLDVLASEWRVKATLAIGAIRT